MIFDDWLSDMTKLVKLRARPQCQVGSLQRRLCRFPGKLARRARTRPHERTARCGSTERKLGAFALMHAEQFRHFSIHYSKEERP